MSITSTFKVIWKTFFVVVVTAAIQTVTISTCAVPTLTDVISEQSLFLFFSFLFLIELQFAAAAVWTQPQINSILIIAQ